MSVCLNTVHSLTKCSTPQKLRFFSSLYPSPLCNAICGIKYVSPPDPAINITVHCYLLLCYFSIVKQILVLLLHFLFFTLTVDADRNSMHPTALHSETPPWPLHNYSLLNHDSYAIDVFSV